MRKKAFATRTVKIGCFLLTVLLSLTFLQAYGLRRLDQNCARLKGYYHQPPQALDVVLLGASEVYTGYSAGRAYEKYGFTSYPYATESITAEGTLLALKEIVRTQTPRLILIEPNAYLYKEDKNEYHDGHIRKLLDNVPLNRNKAAYIDRNVPGEEQREYYAPLIKYHGMWKEYPRQGKKVLLSVAQDCLNAYPLKGYHTRTEMFQPKEKILNNKVLKENKKEKLNPNYEKKLIELLDYCREQQLNVVFFRTPHLVYHGTYGRVKRSNRAAELINSYGYDYLNLEKEWDKIGIDLSADFYNYDHLNIYGTVKFTDYLCRILHDRYRIDKRTPEGSARQEWEDASTAFNKLYRYADEWMRAGKPPQNINDDLETMHTLRQY